MSDSNWLAQKRETILGVKSLVVKVGSAVLTGPQGLELEVIERLSEDLAWLHARGVFVLLVSSGAVAAGRKVLAASLECEGLACKQAAAAVGQSRLMQAYDQAFGRFGIITAQVLLTRDDLRARQRYMNIRNTLHALREWKVLPILNENDSVAVQELVYGDNDRLSGLLVEAVGAELFVNLTSAKGVYSGNPELDPKAKPLACVPDIAGLNIAGLCDGKTSVGSGGMYSKLMAAKRVAQLGVSTLILPGRERGILRRAFEGEEVGTWVMADDKKVSRRKFWLAYNKDPKGELRIDPGAVTALRERGKSLLCAGISAVSGDFKAGALVRIVDVNGEAVGVGLSNYDAADLQKIKGKKSSEIEKTLGRFQYPDAVHRDNMLLDAAL